jgi:hypothetical protein
MLHPVTRHGFTFWEAPRSTKPPLLSIEDLKEINLYRQQREKDHDKPKPPPTPKPKSVPVKKDARKFAFPRKQHSEPPAFTPEILLTIQRAVMETWQITPAQFYGPCRTDHVSRARIASAAIAVSTTGLCRSSIGVAHRRETGWINFAVERYQELLETDEPFKLRAIAAFEAVKRQPVQIQAAA